MKNTLFEDYLGPRLPRQVQLTRVKNVIEQELTPLQREVVLAYYFQGLNICRIAESRGRSLCNLSSYENPGGTGGDSVFYEFTITEEDYALAVMPSEE